MALSIKPLQDRLGRLLERHAKSRVPEYVAIYVHTPRGDRALADHAAHKIPWDAMVRKQTIIRGPTDTAKVQVLIPHNGRDATTPYEG